MATQDAGLFEALGREVMRRGGSGAAISLTQSDTHADRYYATASGFGPAVGETPGAALRALARDAAQWEEYKQGG